MSGGELDQNSVMPQFGGGGAEGSKIQNLSFFPQLRKVTENSANRQKIKSCITSKNQPPKSIRRGDMGISPLFELKNELFLPYLPSIKLGQEIEIRYVHLVRALDMPFGGLDFSALFSAITALKRQFFDRFFFYFYHFLSLFLA